MRRLKNKCIYVVYNTELNRTKIGISINPRMRIKSLICESGCMMELKYSSISMLNSRDIESKIHEQFKQFRGLGEWFNVNPVTVINYIKSIHHEFKTMETNNNKLLNNDLIERINKLYH